MRKSRFSMVSRFAFLVFCAVPCAAQSAAPPATTAAMFTVRELFGVAHPGQILELEYRGGPLDTKRHVMIGPEGVEVPYQQLSRNGNLIVRTPLPRSTVLYGWTAGPHAATDKFGDSEVTFHPNGTAVVVSASGVLPPELRAGKTYFVVQSDGPWFRVSEQYNGAPVSFSAGSGNVEFTTAGFVAQPSTGLIVWPVHGLKTGNPIRVRSSVSLPAPLIQGVTYYAIRVNDDQIKLAASRADAMTGVGINITTPGAGAQFIEIAYMWQLWTGTPAATTPNAVLLEAPATTTPQVHTISNGITGVKVIESPSGPSSLAPIQGVRLAGTGQWAATGPNYIRQSRGGGPDLPILVAKSATTTVIEQGPLQVTFEVNYRFNRPALFRGSTMLIPAGEGTYRSTITLQAGQPSVLIEDETDMDLCYSLNFYDAIRPDAARYRGHIASTAEFGAEPDGGVYRVSTMRPAMDAFRRLQYSVPTYSAYTTAKTAGYDLISRTSAWNPWASNTGWYWMLYNQAARSSAPLAGFFAGRASRVLGYNSGPGVYTMPAASSGGPAAGIQFQSNRSGPDGKYFPKVRFSWGIFSGTKGSAVLNPLLVQPIGSQMNLHGGINLSKVSRYQTETGIPASQLGFLFMNPLDLASFVERLRTDTAFFNEAYAADSAARPLLDFWRSTSANAPEPLALQVMQRATAMFNALVNGQGIYDFHFHYWQGGLRMDRMAPLISALLSDHRSSRQHRTYAAAAAGAFAAVLKDNDFVPLFGGHGLNTGNPNMAVQQEQYRNRYGLLLPDSIHASETVSAVLQSAERDILSTVNEYGAHMGSTHYIGTSMEPLLDTIQQLKVSTGIDLFATSDRLKKFPYFLMNLLTPSEVRFGGPRKLVAIGDSSTESTPLFGQLATNFAETDPALSRKLMSSWLKAGKVHSGFHASSVLKIRPDLPAEDPQLESATFPGYYSVLRSGYGTSNETAAWTINGRHYRDHNHSDKGSTAIYALGAPLSLHWGSLYNPHTAGAYMHNLVLPESGLRHEWNADSPPLNSGTGWPGATQGQFLSFDSASQSESLMQSVNSTVWKRSVGLAAPDPALPVILISDEFTGPDASLFKVSSLNMMAQGAVSTPRGSITPPQRTYNSTTLFQLPSVTPSFVLDPGVHGFGFTGQWLIDWDLYLVNDRVADVALGNWGHTWHSGLEMSEFAKTNGRPFEERQHILRTRSSGPFQAVIVPYRKGQRPANLKVTFTGSEILITTSTSELAISKKYMRYKGATKAVVVSYVEDMVEAMGIRIEGGPAEVSVENGRTSVVIHGPAGSRHITIAGRVHTISYAGGQPLRTNL